MRYTKIQIYRYVTASSKCLHAQDRHRAASSSTNSEIVDPRPFLCDKGAWLTGSAQWLTNMPPPKRHRSGGLPNGHLQLPGARFSSKKVGWVRHIKIHKTRREIWSSWNCVLPLSASGPHGRGAPEKIHGFDFRYEDLILDMKTWFCRFCRCNVQIWISNFNFWHKKNVSVPAFEWVWSRSSERRGSAPSRCGDHRKTARVRANSVLWTAYLNDLSVPSICDHGQIPPAFIGVCCVCLCSVLFCKQAKLRWLWVR